MKKILFFINNLGSGGAQRQIVELAVGLQELGYGVHFFIYQKEYSDYYINYLLSHNIGIDDINEPNYIKRILKVRKYIRTYQPDVLISFLEVSSFMAELASFPYKQWKLIVGERSADPAKRKSLKLKLFANCHMLADYVVANSHSNIDILKEIAPVVDKSKYKVIYNSLDETKFPINVDFDFKRDGNLNIVVASSHRHLKNLNGLIEGVHLLSEEDKCRLKIHWYGSNKFDDSLQKGKEKIQQYQLENVFSFYEPTLDIYEKMKEADAVGLFSHFEGLPNAICEGLFLGKPVIVTRISDMPKIVKDKVNGFLCNTDNYTSIAEALSKLINSSKQELKEMGQNNRKLAKELFSKSEIISEYESLF